MYQQQVSFGDAVKRAFNNYCNFNGRASRSEYWWFALFTALVSYVLMGIGTLIWGQSGEAFSVGNSLCYIWGLITLLPSLGLCWRRLHDTGRAGGYYFIALIPVVGTIIVLIWLCQASQQGPNRFGDQPNMVD